MSVLRVSGISMFVFSVASRLLFEVFASTPFKFMEAQRSLCLLVVQPVLVCVGSRALL